MEVSIQILSRIIFKLYIASETSFTDIYHAILHRFILWYIFLKERSSNKNSIMIFGSSCLIELFFLAKYGICISEISDEINDIWMLLRLIIAFYLCIQFFIIISLISVSIFILSPIASTATTLFNSFLVLQRMAIIFDKKSLSKFLTNK